MKLPGRDRRKHPATVIPLTFPPSFDPSFEAPFNLESTIFPLFPGFRSYDAGPGEVAGMTVATVPTSAGNAVSVDPNARHVDHQSFPGSIPADESCFQGNGRVGRFRIRLPRTVEGASLQPTSCSTLDVLHNDTDFGGRQGPRLGRNESSDHSKG